MISKAYTLHQGCCCRAHRDSLTNTIVALFYARPNLLAATPPLRATSLGTLHIGGGQRAGLGGATQLAATPPLETLQIVGPQKVGPGGVQGAGTKEPVKLTWMAASYLDGCGFASGGMGP